jgi:dihydroneopterin aldolase
MIKISLIDIETFAHHGVFEDEQKNGNTFCTSVTVWYSLEKSKKTDDLNDAFNYQLIFDAVNDEMQTPSKLLENVAWRVAQNLSKKDKNIQKIKVSIAKQKPPISGVAAFSKVSLKWKK